ncbi:MAG TPA: hypothetical protein VG965_02365 [Patescibacteria group bacterium]|nr:hypothetical protein [Patescibacteria group bacterium]
MRQLISSLLIAIVVAVFLGVQPSGITTIAHADCTYTFPKWESTLDVDGNNHDYAQTGKGNERCWLLQVRPGEVGIVGAYKVGGSTKDPYRFYKAGKTYKVDILDGFAEIVPSSMAHDQECFRLQQALDNHWAPQDFLIKAMSKCGDSGRSTQSQSVQQPPAAQVVQAPAPPPPPPPAPPPPPDRTDCASIRGTDYRSPGERSWFLANCIFKSPVGGGSSSSQSTSSAINDSSVCGGTPNRVPNGGGPIYLTNGCANGTQIVVDGVTYGAGGASCLLTGITGSTVIVNAGVFFPAWGEAGRDRCQPQAAAAPSTDDSLCGGTRALNNGAPIYMTNGCADGTTIVVNGVVYNAPSVGQPCYITGLNGNVEIRNPGVFFPSRGESVDKGHAVCVAQGGAPAAPPPPPAYQPPAPPSGNCNPNGILGGNWQATGNQSEWKLTGPATIHGDPTWTINTQAPYEHNPGLPPGVSLGVNGAIAWCDSYKG